MTARGGELERPAGPLLSAHVGEVGRRSLGARGPRSPRLRRVAFAAQVRDRLDEVVHGHRHHAGERHLRPGLGGADQPVEPGSPGALRCGERSRDRAEPPVERQLADRRVPCEASGWELPRGGEQSERDRQVEAGALLAEAGGSEVDRDPPVGPDELGRRDPGADALLGLLAGAVGQADDREGRQPLVQVRLDLDPARLEADERVRDRAGEHAASLGSEFARNRAGSVTISAPRAARGAAAAGRDAARVAHA